MHSQTIPILTFVSLMIRNTPLIGCTNVTKESTLEKPLAVSISRLPTSAFQNHAIISTNLQEESDTKKLSTTVKEVREPSEFDEPVKNKQNKNLLFEPSSTPTNENYVTIGNALKPKFHNYSNYLETGFTPLISSPQYIQDRPTVSRPTEENTNTKFKTSATVKYEHFYTPGFNNHPAYGDVQYHDYNVDLPHPKIQPEVIHLTTFAPPIINPMQRPNLYAYYKNKKKYPFLANNIQEFGKTNDFSYHDIHHEKHPQDFHGSHGYLDNSFLDDNFSHNYKPSYHEKHFKKNGFWQILTTLLPIGLLLSALPPKVVLINSTNAPPPLIPRPPFFRHSDEKTLDEVDFHTLLYNLVLNVGMTPSNDLNCNKLKICETALKGSSGKSSFASYSLWYLFSRSSDSIRKKLFLEDIFEALQRQQCEEFSCSEENVTKKNQT